MKVCQPTPLMFTIRVDLIISGTNSFICKQQQRLMSKSATRHLVMMVVHRFQTYDCQMQDVTRFLDLMNYLNIDWENIKV